MYQQIINSGTTSVSLDQQATTTSLNDATMEQVLYADMIGDYDEQIGEIATDLKTQVQEKQTIRDSIEELYQLQNRETTISDEGVPLVALSVAEVEMLGAVDGLQPMVNEQGVVTGYYIEETQLEQVIGQTIDKKQEELSALNSSGEMTMLKIQELSGKRQSALTLLSNLYRMHRDGMNQIIANFKS
ncbi:MAG: hypothetical protein ABII18_07665 [bacterium]|nr:hypothetical protein [bacterium]MBU1917293.1 hypothetical protein [bacterium]